MVNPKKKNTASSKTVVSKALNKLKMVSPDLDSSPKYLIPNSEFDTKRAKKFVHIDGSKRKRSGSIMNSIKNPFTNRDQYSQIAAAVNERNTLRTGKGAAHSESKSRLNVPRASSRDRVSMSSSQSSKRSELSHSPYDHDASALEKGEFHREQIPLISDNIAESTNYQSFVHAEKPGFISQGNMPTTPIPLPPNYVPAPSIVPGTDKKSSFLSNCDSNNKSSISLFFAHIQRKYPSYITGMIVIFMFVGSMYSISTGNGTQYITAIIKTTLCWLLGSNTAELIFGDGFCELDLQTDAN